MHIYKYLHMYIYIIFSIFSDNPTWPQQYCLFWDGWLNLRNAWNKTMQHTYHTYIPSSYQKLPSKAADIRASSAASNDEQKFTGYSSQQLGTGFRSSHLEECGSSGSYLSYLSQISHPNYLRDPIYLIYRICLIYLSSPFQFNLLYSRLVYFSGLDFPI